MAKNTINLWGRTKTYKGKEYVEFSGAVDIHGTTYIISVNDYSGAVVTPTPNKVNSKTGQPVRGIIFANINPVEKNGGRRGRPSFGSNGKGGY